LKYNIPKATEGTVNATNTNATLVAKAYDPVGGVCLKYETNRAAEVGRLILGFQELGQVMSNIPPTKRKESPVEDETRGEPMAVDEPAKVKAETKMDVVTETKSSGTKKKKKAKR
jgi:hypothetical protein